MVGLSSGDFPGPPELRCSPSPDSDPKGAAKSNDVASRNEGATVAVGIVCSVCRWRRLADQGSLPRVGTGEVATVEGARTYSRDHVLERYRL